MAGGWTALVVAAISAGSAIWQGDESRKAGNKGARAGREAQRVSLLESASQEKRAGMDDAKANRKKPDVTSLLAAEQGPKVPEATMLTGGPGGYDKPRKQLGGRRSLLG